MTAMAAAPRGTLALALALAVSVAACDDGNRTTSSGGAPQQAAPDARAAAEHVEIGRSTHTVAPEPLDASATLSGGETTESTGEAGGGGESLVGEERERDPRSDTVKIRVVVDARRQAHVTWGRKDFGVAPLDIERARNSGPLDLVVVAPGYLPLHARALTDRDDVLNLRLYSPAEAPQLLGYRPEAAAALDSGSAGAPNSLQNKRENRSEAKGAGGPRDDPRSRVRGGSSASNGKTGDEKNPAAKPVIQPSAKKQPK